MNSFLRKIKRSEKEDKQIFMMRNGKILQEKLIITCDNKRNPIRNFSAEELKSATNNYDAQKVVTMKMDNELYKGFLQNHPVSIKKFVDSDYPHEFCSCFNAIVFASQMSHKNVLRLIGCCVETRSPILVFESVRYGTLADRIYHPHQSHFESLGWKQRLKIAMDIANAIAYLHVGLSRPVIFRRLEASNVVFDEEYVPKLFDFSFCASIPEGETHIKDSVMGSFGYRSPEYVATGNCNEKCDVYSYGTLLLELLTGQRTVDRSRQELGDEYFLCDHVRKYIETNRFYEITDPIIVGDELLSAKEQKLQAFTRLAFDCLSVSPDDRPTMVDVAKQLRQMNRSEM